MEHLGGHLEFLVGHFVFLRGHLVWKRRKASVCPESLSALSSVYPCAQSHVRLPAPPKKEEEEEIERRCRSHLVAYNKV